MKPFICNRCLFIAFKTDVDKTNGNCAPASIYYNRQVISDAGTTVQGKTSYIHTYVVTSTNM